MMCVETMLILALIAIVMSLMVYMYINKNKPATTTTTTTKEGFEDNVDLNELISQYEKLDDDKKQAIAKIFGTPFNHEDMIHKSAIPPQKECPKIDMSQYVKRSSIPPCPEPQPCIAPRVVLDAELCKKEDVEEVEPVKELVPLFITKTITVDAEGNKTETVEHSLEGDLDKADELMKTVTTSAEPASTTKVENPQTEETETPSGLDIWSKLKDYLQ